MADQSPATVLLPDTVLTLEPGAPRAEAVAIRDGRIVAVGDRESVSEAAGERAERVERRGALLPAFIDAHHHFCLAALDRRAPDLRLPAGASVADLLERLAGIAAAPGSGWVRAHGYHPLKLREGRPPTAAELDEVCPGRPLLVSAYSLHEGVLNRAGLRALGWDDRSPDPPGGLLRRRRGRLTGEIAEAAFFMAEAASRGSLLEHGEDAWLEEVEQHGRELLRHGIVRVGDAAVPPAFERLYARAEADGRLPVTVHRMPVGRPSLLHERLDGAPTGEGPDAMPAGPAKLFLDGAEQCAICVTPRQLARMALNIVRPRGGGRRLAALRAAVRTGGFERHGLHFHHGIRFWDRTDLTQVVEEATERGFQVALHALGNAAVDQACGVLEATAAATSARPGRPRIEHAMLLGPRQPARIAATGAIAVVQPSFVGEQGDELLLSGLPDDLAVFPLRSLGEAGVTLAGSSDYPVAGYDVLAAVRAAVTRRTRSGAVLLGHEAIAVEQALRAYTAGAAAALGVEQRTGTIAAGKDADLVLLSADPLAADLAALEVRATWRRGRLAWEAGAT